jgi:hypothetical protein
MDTTLDTPPPEMTPAQHRTLEGLIGTGERPSFPGDLVQGVRDRIEEAVRAVEPSEPLWIGKPTRTIGT